MRGLFIKLLAFLILLTFVILSFVALPTLYKTRPILVAYHPYSKLQHPQWGILIRFLWYPVSMLLSAAVVCLVPQKENRLSYIGASTLPIYFFHRPLLYVIMDTGLGAWLFGVSPLLFLACGLPLALLLSWPKLNIPFNHLMKIPLKPSPWRGRRKKSPVESFSVAIQSFETADESNLRRCPEGADEGK